MTEYEEMLRRVLGRALREEEDIHSTFSWSRFLRTGADAHFDCRYVVAGEQRLGLA